ncbi:MAG: hypothetical protein ACREEM_02270 [Blastocatellia bacterium]
MKRSCLNAMVCVLLTSSLFVSACERPSRAGVTDPARNAALPDATLPDAALKDLQNLEELRTRFNQDKGAPRLILLLSPT